MNKPAGLNASDAGTARVGDLTVHRMGFGAMRLCAPDVWGRPKDRSNEQRVLHRVLDFGINFIDTADSYGPEANEHQIAEALHPYPAGLVIATKGGLLRPKRSAWVPDGRPEHLRRALEGSLKRLRLERIDLYQLHAPDPAVPFADSVGALAEMQRAGKIRHVGVSNVSVAQLDEARRIVTVVSVQNEYNLRERSSDDVLAACTKLGIAFLPWYPLGGNRGLKAASIKRVAERHGVGASQVALAWLLGRSPMVVPIPGTQSVEHLEDNLRAAKLRLAPQDLAELE